MLCLHQIHVAQIQVVSTCITYHRLHVSRVSNKIVVNVALWQHVSMCIHLYLDTSCSSGILVSGVNAA